MHLLNRFRRLSVWNKLAAVGSIASIIGILLAIYPSRPATVALKEGLPDPKTQLAPSKIVDASTLPATRPSGDTRLTVERILQSVDSIPQLRQSDAVRALYFGREVESVGTVDFVDETPGDEKNDHKQGFVLELKGLEGQKARHIAYFDTSWHEPLSSLKKGDTVRVTGTLSGVWVYLRTVYSKSARLVPR